jgi:hypothetical protein
MGRFSEFSLFSEANMAAFSIPDAAIVKRYPSIKKFTAIQKSQLFLGWHDERSGLSFPPSPRDRSNFSIQSGKTCKNPLHFSCLASLRSIERPK